MDLNGVKLLLTYDPLPDQREEYFRYVLSEFIPAMENLGLTMCEAWHTAYGPYPLRLLGFMISDRSSLSSIMDSDDFQDLEGRLQEYVMNYRRKVVEQDGRFQF